MVPPGVGAGEGWVEERYEEGSRSWTVGKRRKMKDEKANGEKGFYTVS